MFSGFAKKDKNETAQLIDRIKFVLFMDLIRSIKKQNA